MPYTNCLGFNQVKSRSQIGFSFMILCDISCGFKCTQNESMHADLSRSKCGRIWDFMWYIPCVNIYVSSQPIRAKYHVIFLYMFKWKENKKKVEWYPFDAWPGRKDKQKDWNQTDPKSSTSNSHLRTLNVPRFNLQRYTIEPTTEPLRPGPLNHLWIVNTMPLLELFCLVFV